MPEDAVFIPLLDNCYVSNICEDLPSRVMISQFVNDIAVYCSRLSLDSCKRLIARATIANNIEDLGLELSPLKIDFI